MNNEEKILSILTVMQSDISGLKSDVSALKSDVSALKSDVSDLNTRVGNLENGQIRIENKIDKFSVIENDDVVALVKITSEIRQNVKAIHTDVLYLVEKTLDNSKQILKIVK